MRFNGVQFLETQSRMGHMSRVLHLSHCQAGHANAIALTCSLEDECERVCVRVCEATGHARHHKNVTEQSLGDSNVATGQKQRQHNARQLRT